MAQIVLLISAKIGQQAISRLIPVVFPQNHKSKAQMIGARPEYVYKKVKMDV